MNVSVLNKAEALLAEAHGGEQAAVGGGFIKMLIDMFMNLIGDCGSSGGTPASIIKLARSNNARDKRAAELLVERSVRRDMRRRHGWFGYARYNGDQIVQTYLKVALLKDDDGEYKVSEQDVADFMQLAGS